MHGQKVQVHKEIGDGLTILGQCYAVGEGCEQNEARALELFQMGAELEDPTAMYELGCRYPENSVLRYRVWGQSAKRGCRQAVVAFAEAAKVQMRFFQKEVRTGWLVFEVGAACKGHVDFEFKTIFGFPVLHDHFFFVEESEKLHEQWRDVAKRSIVCWLWCAKQLGTCRDIRNLIAKLLFADCGAWSHVREPLRYNNGAH